MSSHMENVSYDKKLPEMFTANESVWGHTIHNWIFIWLKAVHYIPSQSWLDLVNMFVSGCNFLVNEGPQHIFTTSVMGGASVVWSDLTLSMTLLEMVLVMVCLQPTSPCKSSSVLSPTESHLLLKMPPTTLTWWSGQWLCHPISDERQMWSQWVRHVCSLQDCIQLCNIHVGLYSTNIYLSSPYISSHLQHWRGNFLGSFRDLVDKIGILMQKKESLHLIMVSHPSFF